METRGTFCMSYQLCAHLSMSHETRETIHCRVRVSIVDIYSPVCSPTCQQLHVFAPHTVWQVFCIAKFSLKLVLQMCLFTHVYVYSYTCACTLANNLVTTKISPSPHVKYLLLQHCCIIQEREVYLYLYIPFWGQSTLSCVCCQWRRDGRWEGGRMLLAVRSPTSATGSLRTTTTWTHYRIVV